MQIIGAIIGLIAGFAFGLVIVNWILKDKTKEELRTNKDLQIKYGGLSWLIAIAVATCGWYVFPIWFG